jgi:hypothetical protein
LEGGPPCFPQGFSCPVVLRIPLRPAQPFAYRPITSYGRAFHPGSAEPCGCYLRGPTTPRTLSNPGFGLLPVRSPLLGESRLISTPPGTEMFHFPGFAPHGYVFTVRCLGFTPDGFPHSDTHGSKLARSSPWLFAACRVLPRSPMPGHSPYALNVLTLPLFSKNDPKRPEPSRVIYKTKSRPLSSLERR